VINVDLDETLLAYCRKVYPKAILIKADLDKGLPEIQNLEKVDVVVALDVLEHFTVGDCVKLLVQLREKMAGRPFVLIVLMPVIYWTKVPTWFEWFRKIRDSGKVSKGLFDSTHKIFMGQRGHKELFKRAGFGIMEEQVMNAIDVITGDWKTLDLGKVTWLKNPEPLMVQQVKVARFIAGVCHPFDKSKREKQARDLLTHRDFYVLRPK